MKTANNLWTAAEDQIALRFIPRKAVNKLPGRTLSAITQRRYRLQHPHLFRTDGLRWTREEKIRLRRLYPNAQRNSELAKHFPGKSLLQITNKASHMKIKRRYLGEASLPDALELVDQIRIRAKEDGISFKKLDEICKSGTYFMNSYKKLSQPRIKYIVKAVEFFGGKLVIDWRDR